MMGTQPTMNDIAKIKAAWDRDIAEWKALRVAAEAVLDAERRMDVQAMDRAMTKLASALASSIADPISSEADFAPKSLDCNAKGLISSAEESSGQAEPPPVVVLSTGEVERLHRMADGLERSAKLDAELAEELAGDAQFAMVHRTAALDLKAEADALRKLLAGAVIQAEAQ